MKRLMKILLGLSIGAALAILFAPKSGRKLREQLMGGATGKFLPPAPVAFPEPEGERPWDAGTVTAVEEPPVVEPAIVEEVIATEPEDGGEATSEDLRVRIEETRAAVESDIAHPFSPVVVEEPVAEEPVVEEPVVEEPVVEVVEEPVVEEPVAEVVEEPVVEEPLAEEPVVEVVEEPVAEEPVVEEPVAEEPVVEEPEAEVVEEPVVEEPLAEEPVVEEPVAEVVEEPVVAEPVAEEPVVEEPAAREGEPIDQAEMRRRIEETRARLKAKAFDAMMSGESALLSRDSGEKPVPKGDEVKLDGELESSIDESLSQEEY
jgi:hypothetical protein